MKDFIEKNIQQINSSITYFKKKKPNDTQIKNYLREKFLKEVESVEKELFNEIEEHNYVKARIEDIANKYIFYKRDLEKFYDTNIYNNLMQSIGTDELVNELSEKIKNEINNERAYNFIKKDLEKITEKLMCLLKIKGFSSNILGINDGVMLANSGDSAQFLFISRAILAGFNCSNVDVRSSRYDAIIDFDGKLLKVQVKGISNNTISFKDRDRGGQGIDHTHERNKGKIITSEDCDIYVAVDKECGVCYIIPMRDYVDKLPTKKKLKTINIQEVEQFRENWEVIKQTVNRK